MFIVINFTGHWTTRSNVSISNCATVHGPFKTYKGAMIWCALHGTISARIMPLEPLPDHQGAYDGSNW
jgi:hypothetical protein